MESGIMVTNIRSSVDEKTIRSHFDKFGKILYVNIVPDRLKENFKVCYMNFNSSESAKNALEHNDKSTVFGDQLRISYKKVTCNHDKSQMNGNVNNPISRSQSFGRGRGFAMESNKPRSVSQPVMLRNIDLQLNNKIEVEIVELQNINSILARPINETETTKQNLSEILNTINENVNSLTEVRVPEIGGFYLAQWKDDGNFYRAKLLEKLGNNKYQVCFVDEGTSGDIVEQLRNIPNELSEIPCQFVQCTMECKDLPELVKLIVSNGYTAKVSVYITNPELADGCKYRISLFLNNNDSIDLFKKKFKEDPRLNPIPNEVDVKKHPLQAKLAHFQVLNYPKDKNEHFQIVMMNKVSEVDGKLQVLEYSPIPGDVVLYRCPGSAPCRVVVQSVSFATQKPSYTVRYLDRSEPTLSVSFDTLRLPIDKKSLIEIAPQVLNCVMDPSSGLITANDVQASLTIQDFNSDQMVYVVSLDTPPPKPKPKPVSEPALSVGKSVRAVVTSVETPYEFYAQLIDPEVTKQLDSVLAVIADAEPIGTTLLIEDLAVGTEVVAPYFMTNYRALVDLVKPTNNMVRVFFIDYGNRYWIEFNKLMRAPREGIASTAETPALALQCSLPVLVKRDADNAVTKLLNEYCEGGDIELVLKVISEPTEGRSGFGVDLRAENKSGFLDILEFKKLVDDTPVTMTTPSTSTESEAVKMLAKLELLERRVLEIERQVKVNQIGK